MIRVDPREGSKQYAALLSRLGVPTTLELLPYGDLAFEGLGPVGIVTIGIEVKTLADYESSFRTKRLQQQLRGMLLMYDYRFLLVYGRKPYEGIEPGQLFSITFQTGTMIAMPADEEKTADWIQCLYNWWQKPWAKHSTMKGIQLPRAEADEESLIPVKPSAVRQIAACLPGVGWELSGRVAKHFGFVRTMMNAEREEWLKIEGLGPKKVDAVMAAIRGRKA